METAKVGIRKFRENLADYMAGQTPVMVTNHGQTVGYFIPARGSDAAMSRFLLVG